MSSIGYGSIEKFLTLGISGAAMETSGKNSDLRVSGLFVLYGRFSGVLFVVILGVDDKGEISHDNSAASATTADTIRSSISLTLSRTSLFTIVLYI